MKIDQLIEGERLKLFQDSYQMSIGELANLYEANDLTIDPDFQRELRWLNTQKVRFIESILLNFPLPSIFVASRPNGTWDLLDGLQRISTILQFMGILRDESGVPVPPLMLTATDRFPALQGLYFNDSLGTPALSSKLQVDFKRQRLDLKIILRQSHPDLVYDLFTRLAIGGTQLTSQDVRNAMLTKNDFAFKRWLDELVSDVHFKRALSLSDSDLKRRYDYELALVFLVLLNEPLDNIEQMQDLDEALNVLIKSNSRLYDYDRDDCQKMFEQVFSAIDDAAGPNAFEPTTAGQQSGGLSRGAFVALSAASVSAIKDGVEPNVNSAIRHYWSLEPIPESFMEQVAWGRQFHHDRL